MANFVSQELRTAMLKSYFNRDIPATSLFLRLFTSSANFNEDTTLPMVATVGMEQRGTGYAPKELSWNVPAAPAQGDWTVSTVLGGVRVTLKDQTWTTAEGIAWGDLQYAVLTDSLGFITGSILMVRDYGSGKTVTGIGATVTVDNLYYQINDI